MHIHEESYRSNGVLDHFLAGGGGRGQYCIFPESGSLEWEDEEEEEQEVEAGLDIKSNNPNLKGGEKKKIGANVLNLFQGISLIFLGIQTPPKQKC